MHSFFSELRKKIRTLAVLFILSIVVTFAIQHIEGTQVESLVPTTTITISEETVFAPTYEAFVKKGFFESIAKVYVCLSSPYVSCWKTFNVWMSLDNSSWIAIPFLESPTNDTAQMAMLGFIQLDNPQIKIYQKYYIPPQTIYLPVNVTKQDAYDLKSNVVVKKEATPADRIQWIIAFFAVFAFIDVIWNRLFSRKASISITQNVVKREKKLRRNPRKTRHKHKN